MFYEEDIVFVLEGIGSEDVFFSELVLELDGMSDFGNLLILDIVVRINVF